jgi:predicted RNA-binding protein with EMAP domain
MIETSISEVLDFCDEALSDAEDLEYELAPTEEYMKCENVKKIVDKLNSMRNQLIVIKELDWESIYREKLQDESWTNFGPL